jgi:hypothetical protein
LNRFRIIVLEIHELNVLKDVEEAEKALAPLLRKLDTNFVCVHAHPNNCREAFMLFDTGFNVPIVHEITFLRRDRFADKAGADWYKPLIPHPLDISWNVPNKSPLFLSAAWCSNGSRDFISRITMARCVLDAAAAKAARKVWGIAKSWLPFLSK